MSKFKDIKDINNYLTNLEGRVIQHATNRAREHTSDPLFKVIDTLIETKLKELKFNWTETGVIKKDNGDGTYEVSYGRPIKVLEKNADDDCIFVEKDTTTLPAITGMKYEINDTVYIEVVNNNYSFKYIKCKRPKGL